VKEGAERSGAGAFILRTSHWNSGSRLLNPIAIHRREELKKHYPLVCKAWAFPSRLSWIREQSGPRENKITAKHPSDSALGWLTSYLLKFVFLTAGLSAGEMKVGSDA
jgi:hypothetical protein